MTNRIMNRRNFVINEIVKIVGNLEVKQLGDDDLLMLVMAEYGVSRRTAIEYIGIAKYKVLR